MMDDLAALRWQLEWGADEAVGVASVDRLAPAPAPAGSTPRIQAAPTARAAVRAESLEALAAAVDASDGGGLRTTATRTVRWSGAAGAAAMLVAEAPGADEDQSGIAFSGASGRLMDRLLGSAGLSRETVLLSYLVPWRPPGGRKVSDREISAALPYLHGLLALVRPRGLLLVGGAAVKALTGSSESVRKLRGRWLEVSIPELNLLSRALPLPPMEQWLDSARAKEQLWRDLVSFQKGITTT